MFFTGLERILFERRNIRYDHSTEVPFRILDELSIWNDLDELVNNWAGQRSFTKMVFEERVHARVEIHQVDRTTAIRFRRQGQFGIGFLSGYIHMWLEFRVTWVQYMLFWFWFLFIFMRVKCFGIKNVCFDIKPTILDPSKARNVQVLCSCNKWAILTLNTIPYV